jgi:hypothetical protein
MRDPESPKQFGDFLGAKITDRDYYRRKAGTRPSLTPTRDDFYQAIEAVLVKAGYQLPPAKLAALVEAARKHKAGTPEATLADCINMAVSGGCLG